MNVRLFGKNIFTTKHHLIMEYNIPLERPYCNVGGVLQANVDNFPSWRGGYSHKMLTDLIESNGCVGFYYVDEKNGQAVGTIWVMYSGGDEIEYKVRNIDAFIFNVYVKEEYRGKGIASRLLDIAIDEIGRRGIQKCYLAVRTDNKSAIRAYDKYGFHTVDKKFFVRFLGINIPYITL